MWEDERMRVEEERRVRFVTCSLFSKCQMVSEECYLNEVN